jgi:hypothetical protein
MAILDTPNTRCPYQLKFPPEVLDTFPALDTLTVPTVSTEIAAYYLNRKPQTLHLWACRGGPIKPLRVEGRLAWPVEELRRVLGVEPKQ